MMHTPECFGIPARSGEKLHLFYTNNSATAVTANVTPIPYTNRLIDTHNAWNGSQFRAPFTGSFFISFCMNPNASNSFNSYLYLNGTQAYKVCENTSAQTHRGSITIPLNINDAIDLRLDSGSDNLASSSVNHWISIHSIN